MEELYKVLKFYGFAESYQSSLKIVCPFHDDVNPSMQVDLQKNYWFCYGCNKSGDSFDFVKQIEKNKLNDLQALKKMHKIIKSEKTEKIKIDSQEKQKIKKQNKQLYCEAWDYYHGLKKINWCRTLKNSKNDVVEIEEIKNYMIDRGFKPKMLELSKAKITYNKNYPFIFPMHDNGKYKGWVARTTDKEVEKKRKYLYNTGFRRLTTLVGDYGKKDYLFVCEGYMDRLKFIQHCPKEKNNIIAILGWKMTKPQIEKIKNKNIKLIISVLDNDKCGKKGTKYLEEVFGKKNVIRFCYLKNIKDVGETNKKQFKKMYFRTMQKLKTK